MDIFSLCVNMIFLGTVAERKEFRQVQQLMESGTCLNAGLYEEFKIKNPTGGQYLVSIYINSVLSSIWRSGCRRRLPGLLVLRPMCPEVRRILWE